jgi:hypothetical protein
MSALDQPLRDSEAVGDPPREGLWTRVEVTLARWAERINPIVVKEARQALRSAQFAITFLLMLTACWIWAVFRIAASQASLNTEDVGPELFMGFQVILAFPLLIVVPLTAFRSLALEIEDRTHELVAITSLAPKQIVLGKLASAGLQMLVYLSAVSPFVAFTFLLQGIDLPSIVFVLLYVALGSLGLTVLGLLGASLSRERIVQTMLLVVLVVVLVYAFGLSIAGVGELVLGGWFVIELADEWFWIGNAAIGSAYACVFAMAMLATAARLTFEADNRSTRLRICMTVHQAVFAGWMGWLFWNEVSEDGQQVTIMLFAIFSGIYWTAMGAMMAGESPELSLRVRRGLPQSALGRLLFTWYYPGPGTGYVLAVSSMLAVAMVCLALAPPSLRPAFGFFRFQPELALLATFVLFYVVFYLGLGKLAMDWLRRRSRGGWFLSLIVHAVIVFLGTVPTVMLELFLTGTLSTFTLLQTFNPVVALVHCVFSPVNGDMFIALWTLGILATGIFLLNLPSVMREIRAARVERPKRVEQEDAEIEALRRPAIPVPTSPWD